MHIFPSLLAALLLLLLPFTAAGQIVDRTHIVDSLRAELKAARTPLDSVSTMSNLYDLMPRNASSALGDSLILTALRAKDHHTAMDVIRSQASRRKTDEAYLDTLVSRTMVCPDGSDRRETLTFIRLMSNIACTREGDSVDQEHILKSFIKELEGSPNSDIYNRIALTHGICMILSDDPSGDMLVAYMDSLNKLTGKLPVTAYNLRNTIHAHTASVFAYWHPYRSVEADQNVLNDIARLEKYYNDNGRVYRNYHPSYYTVFTRMLSNYQVLSPDQIEHYYRKALAEIDYDPSTRLTYEEFRRPDIYYAMYHKDYRKALELITAIIDKTAVRTQRLQFLSYMIECAEALGYKETLIKAQHDYIAELEKEMKEHSGKSYRELQTAYAIYETRHNLGTLEMERQESLADMQRIVIIVAAIALAVLAVLVIILFRQYRKNRQLANSLRQTNQRLEAEGENLRTSKAELIRARDQAQKANNLKSDFIKNMSYEVKVPLQAITEYSHLIADCAAGSTDAEGVAAVNPAARHLARFADLLELNCELLGTIINDVLRLSEIESNPLPVQSQVVQLKALCDATIAGVRHRVEPGVKLQLDPAVDKLDIFTDPSRLQQILNNLLINASKFTKSGSITLSYANDADDKNVIISVTDTGIGINPENKEKIFDRFVKLDRETQGAGLGLTISRLLARHLGGDLWLDTSYKGGARFSLSIPKK